MSKPTLETSKKLINLLYSSTASKLPSTKGSIISDITTPTISRILYQDLSSTGTTDNVLDLTSSHSSLSILKFPNNQTFLQDSSKQQTTFVNSNIVRFKCPILYITKNDILKSIPTTSSSFLGSFNNVNGLKNLNRFELIKKRDYRINTNQALKFLGEYYMIFENQLLANQFINQTTTKPSETETETETDVGVGVGIIMNGMKINFEIIKLNESILKTMSNEKISDFNKINEILSIIDNPNTDTDFNFDVDVDVFQILNNWLNHNSSRRRNNYVLVQNWPFGLSQKYISKLLWNYKLLDIITIKSDIKQQLNIILLKFDNYKDCLRFIRNYHGKKWDHLQLKSNNLNKEIIFYQPLLCETL